MIRSRASRSAGPLDGGAMRLASAVLLLVACCAPSLARHPGAADAFELCETPASRDARLRYYYIVLDDRLSSVVDCSISRLHDEIVHQQCSDLHERHGNVELDLAHQKIAANKLKIAVLKASRSCFVDLGSRVRELQATHSRRLDPCRSADIGKGLRSWASRLSAEGLVEPAGAACLESKAEGTANLWCNGEESAISSWLVSCILPAG